MLEYPVDHPALPALFDPFVPDNPALWAVFKGRHAGRALVDDLHSPTQCLLRTDALLTYASRQITLPFLAQALASFIETSDIWLIWASTNTALPAQPQPACVIPRLEFYDCDPGSERLAGLRQSLPEGCEMRPVDRQLLERCEWRADMEFFCGSLENFLLNDAGLCMLRGDEILVEAYVSSFGETQAEIGAVTREPYRGRGYAPVACAYLIQLCAQRGYAAYWSCDADNQASIRVAQKLGFRQTGAYQVVEYRALR
jgi:GNAT superfamily N-acetyltransferase